MAVDQVVTGQLRRDSSWSSCLVISVGKLDPTCCLKYVRSSSTSSNQNCLGTENSCSMSTGSSRPSRFISASAVPSHRRKIQSSTRTFSPNPGHRKPPEDDFRNQLTTKMRGRLNFFEFAPRLSQ